MGKDPTIVPFRSVPLIEDKDRQNYKKVNKVRVDLVNELQNKNGTFGWCFVCRESAELFCKDTRVPLCSQNCKDKHMLELIRTFPQQL